MFSGETALFEVIALTMVSYFFFFMITLLKMIWTLLPSNRSKPFPKDMMPLSFLTLLAGLISCSIICLFGFNKGWSKNDIWFIPIFSAPLLLFILMAIKKRYVTPVIVHSPPRISGKELKQDFYDEDYYYPDQQ